MKKSLHVFAGIAALFPGVCGLDIIVREPSKKIKIIFGGGFWISAIATMASSIMAYRDLSKQEAAQAQT